MRELRERRRADRSSVLVHMEAIMTGRSRWGASFIVTMMSLFLVVAVSAPAHADDVGQIKVSKGAVHIERGGQRLPGAVGVKVQPTDVIVTGPDGSVGILFVDASLLSAGPTSLLAIHNFLFHSTTNQTSSTTP